MKFNEYQKAALGFRLPSADSEYARLNLAGEVGELLSLFAKASRDGIENVEVFLQNVEKEAGDILWCLAAVLKDCGIEMEDAAIGNIAKLTLRKAHGTIKGSGDDR